MIQFIKGRLKSFIYAFRGLYLLIKTEHSIIAQIIIFSVVIILGFSCGITKQEWVNQTLAMGLVLGIEGANTAIEKLCNFIHKEQHPRIAFIKDVSAGAVTFAALAFLTIFIMTYLPYVL